MPPTELLQEGEHLMTVCNACRYCEGYCAVWQTMESRLVFVESDLNYLANLCHNCGECFYSCQYSPPHEFNINPPKTLAKIRLYTYGLYAWPGPLAKAFCKNGLLVSLLAAAVLIAFLLAASLALGSRLWEPVRGGDFYQIIPHSVMALTFSVVGSFSALALLIGFLRFWRDSGESYSTLANPVALFRAAKDVLSLKNLDNDGAGCSYPREKSSEALRWFHHATFYGFLSCLVATTLGAIYYYVFGWHGPPGFLSLPVIFGTVGGIGLVIGPIGLFVLLRRRNREIVDENQSGMDLAFIVLLLLISISGLLLLLLRQSAAMGTLLVVHLGFVMTLFLTMPYGKFVHGIYRSGALLKWALERSRQSENKAKA
ncbi:MAG: tricarballylate utilization 4Fe-4S protein TcuB [Candidatus Acidiferrum sp.]|jgi:citrate/tricarballylate utilization protein